MIDPRGVTRPVRLALVVSTMVLMAGCARVDQAPSTPGPASSSTGPVPTTTQPTTSVSAPGSPRPVRVATTSGDQSGNRVVSGRAELAGAALEVALEASAAWIVGIEVGDRLVWVVTDDKGGVSAFAEFDGDVTPFPLRERVTLPAGMPPTVIVDDGDVTVLVPQAALDMVAGNPPAAPLAGVALAAGTVVAVAADGTVFVGRSSVPGVTALPDTRIVVSRRGDVALLAEPTKRLAHGVLGDVIESEVVVVIDPVSASVRTVLDAPDETVFEAVSPMWADVDGDGVEEVVVTSSDDRFGARLTVYGDDGELRAESEPIGRGSRWLNQLAAGPVGPDGELELIDVRTPHIGGVVRWYRLDGEMLELHAEAFGFSTHRIGSRNLDQGVVVDADADGQLDVVVPTQDGRFLVGLARVGDRAIVVAEAPLGARLSSNVAAAARADGTASLAAGTDDGRLLIWP